MIVLMNADDSTDYIVGDSVPMDWEEDTQAKVSEVFAINRNLPYYHFMSANRKITFSFLLKDYNIINNNTVESRIKWLNDKCLSTTIGIKHPRINVHWSIDNTTVYNFDSDRDYYLLSVRVTSSVINREVPIGTAQGVARQTAIVQIELGQATELNVTNL